MKFILPLTLFTLNIFFCKANDTLTVAQVYNFDVGDTFDYYWFNVQIGGYERIVIKDISYSTDSLTLYITQQIVYPTPNDANLNITGLSTYQIYQDTTTRCTNAYVVAIDTNSKYNGRLLNDLTTSCDGNSTIDDFVEGLGDVYSFNEIGNANDEPPMDYLNKLIFYSKHGEHWGTPYTIAGVNNIQQQTSISVYPTINSGNFQVVTDGIAGKMQFTLYDIFGRPVKAENIYGGKNPIQVSGLAPGVYLWNVNSPEGLVRSGKIIIE